MNSNLIEALESRQLLSVTISIETQTWEQNGITVENNTLWVTGDSRANSIDLIANGTLVDSDSPGIHIKADGKVFHTDKEIHEIGIDGGAGNDRIVIRTAGFRGNNLEIEVRGGTGNDRITASADCRDLDMKGGAGNDMLRNDSMQNGYYLFGDFGNDVLYGSNADDILQGGDGNDVLYGLAGNDYLSGGNGNDLVFGGAGNDFFAVGTDKDLGTDILIGGSDWDVVHWSGSRPMRHILFGIESVINDSNAKG